MKNNGRKPQPTTIHAMVAGGGAAPRVASWRTERSVAYMCAGWKIRKPSVQSKIACAQLTPLERRRPRRDGCERERDEGVVARKREAEEAPSRVVATHDRDRLQLVEEPARRTEILERARAFLRPRPPFPFDTGRINAEPGVPGHAERDGDERRKQHLARGADLIAKQHHDRERNGEVIGVALLEAKRARLHAEPVLKDPRAEDGGRADRRDRGRCRRHRPLPDHAEGHLAHARAGCRLCPLLHAHITVRRRQWYGAVDRLPLPAMIADKPLWRNW